MAPLKKVTSHDAVRIAGPAKLSAAAMALTGEGFDTTAFVGALIERELYMDAVRFLAHALPKREAVWWACVCARETLPADAPPEVSEALQAAEAWVYKPTEENRRAAMASAERAEFGMASSWAAVGAFWSGGSMAPANAPVVPPGEMLTAAATSGAIMLAAVQEQPELANDKYRRFLEAGIDIADGGNGRRRAASAS